MVRPGYTPEDGQVDLLLSNDVLSEGQNLQQAGAVISYDMPWNPQRMVQRYGRVIRLKSPHDEVSLTTMLPEAGDLEEILKLEIAIRRKNRGRPTLPTAWRSKSSTTWNRRRGRMRGAWPTEMRRYWRKTMRPEGPTDSRARPCGRN